MKNLTKVLLLIAVGIIFLAGCSSITRVGVVVDKNEDVKMVVVSAMDNEMIDAFLSMQSSSETEEGEEATEATEAEETKVYTDDERWAYLESSNEDNTQYEGYEKAKYEEGEFKGYTYTRNLGKLAEVSSDKEEVVDFSDVEKETKIFTKKGDVYSLHISNSSGDESIAQAKEYNDQYGSQGANFVVEFYVTLPQEATSNNATTVSEDKLTYTWDLLKTSNIDIEFKDPSAAGGNNMLPIIIGAVVVVLIIAGVAVVATKKKEG